MTEIGIVIDCEDKVIRWEAQEIPMKEHHLLSSQEVLEIVYFAAGEPQVVLEAEDHHAKILYADYSKVNMDEYVHELSYLTPEQIDLLGQTLKKFPILFGGGLGTLKIPPIDLELKEGAKPYHARPFPVPQCYERTTKVEMDRLTKIGVFNKNYDSEWAAPTFVQPKKTGDVGILTDFRKLNEQLKRTPYPLPKIAELLRKLRGFQWATALDLGMGYYHIPLSKQAQRLCSTILPWGKYQYQRLPMGIKCSPDIFQRVMNELLGDCKTNN